MKLLFEKSIPGRRGLKIHKTDVPTSVNLKKQLLRQKTAELPELSELDVIRHFTELSRRNFGVDTNFYPLGSCTMKYNPKVTERIASYPGFTHIHPLMPQLRMGGILTQGALQVLYETDLLLREITGMNAFTMQPMAGAHGELTGIMIIAAYHREKANKKTTILIPDSAHGTNPASAAIAGYAVKSVPSDSHGLMDINALKDMLDEWESKEFELLTMVDGKKHWKDLCVVNSWYGPSYPCEWIEYDPEKNIVWLKGHDPGAAIGPAGRKVAGES